MLMKAHYNPTLVALSVLVAIFASFTALSLAASVANAKGRLRLAWLAGGSLAMGFGIWSMHFVGMLAFSISEMTMAYDLPLMTASILIAIGASAIALFVVSRQKLGLGAYIGAGTTMGVAIAGMHYTGMASMRMAARIEWNYGWVVLSVAIAIVASFGALWTAFALRRQTARASILRITGATLFILVMALAGTAFDRALARRTAQARENAKLFQEANRALQALREERELRERFASSLTHDLRTPLTAAKLSAQLMMRQLDQPEKARRLGEKVVDGLERMDQMIRDLLDAHRISAQQKLPLKLDAFNLTEIIQQTIDSLAVLYGARFVFHPQDEIQGFWDCEYLRRAIENLCSNAVKYGYAHTPITLSVVASESDDAAWISVHNEGEALGPEERSDLFQLFHRSRSAQAKGTGWGIGLTLVKGVAEAHGGSVHVESEPGRGTTFTLRIPRDSRLFVDAARMSRPSEDESSASLRQQIREKSRFL